METYFQTEEEKGAKQLLADLIPNQSARKVVC